MPQLYLKRNLGDLFRIFNLGSDLTTKIRELSTENSSHYLFDTCHRPERTFQFLKGDRYFFFNATDEKPFKGFNPEGELCDENGKIKPYKKYAVKKNMIIIDSGIFADRYNLIVNTFDQSGKQVEAEASL